jgi:F-type H+-transporting ATPase subunit delta
MEEQVGSELRLLVKKGPQAPQGDLWQKLRHPFFPLQSKMSLVSAEMGAPLSPLMNRFLQLIIRRKRLDLLPEIWIIFDRLSKDVAGVVPLLVKTAVPLSREQVLSLKESFGRPVDLEIEVDDNLLAGLIVRMGDKMWDASLRGQLNSLLGKR